MRARVLSDCDAQCARLFKTPRHRKSCPSKITSTVTSRVETSRIILRKYPTVLLPVLEMSVAVVALGRLPGTAGGTDTGQGRFRPEGQVRGR